MDLYLHKCKLALGVHLEQVSPPTEEAIADYYQNLAKNRYFHVTLIVGGQTWCVSSLGSRRD
jgi:hypothetical protein